VSAKNLHNTLSAMLRQAKEVPTKNLECDPSKILKSIPRKKLLPTKEDLKKQINRIVDDSLTAKGYMFISGGGGHKALEAFMNTKEMTKWVERAGGKSYGDFSAEGQKDYKEYYHRVRRMLKTGYNIYESKFKRGECTINVVTNLKPTKFKADEKKYNVTIVDWEITTTVSIDCPCTDKNKSRVKKAVYVYSTNSQGPLRFNRYVIEYGMNKEVVMYGMRFGKILNPKLKLKKIECCKENEKKAEDGSFISPDEDINNKNNFIDTGLGIGFGKESDTEAIISGGYLFNVGDVGNNPLYVGPKATVNTTSLSGNDIKETRVLVGPTAEYQIPVGAGNTKIVTGINSGYLFGSVDSFGFKQNLSGFAANAYAGVQINIGNNIALGVLLNFLEFSSITFKADNGEFKNTVSNTAFLTDRGAISVGVRIGLDKN
jgi:hypothetical protein